MMKLLKMDPEGIERLFSGRPIALKSGVNANTAKKYQKAIEATGAFCTLEPSKQNESAQDRPDSLAADSVPPTPQPAAPVTNRVVKTANGGDMIITNIESVPGKRMVEHFGLVSGSTIRAKHVGRDIMASLKNLVGGELKGYTELLQESRQQAMNRMIEQAGQLGANAIVNIRFSTSSVAQGAAELYAYGTAVHIK